MKWCPKCDLFRRPDAFAESSTSLDGKQSWCRDCKAKSRPRNAELPVVGDCLEKQCSKCEEVLPAGNFSLLRAYAPEYGRQHWCKECMRAYRMDRRQAKQDAAFLRLVRENNKRDLYEIENARKRETNLTNPPASDTVPYDESKSV